MISEGITTSILASIIYDMLKNSLTLSSANLKQRLRDWIINDDTLSIVEKNAADLDLNSEMSELAIEKRIQSSSELLNAIQTIKPSAEAATIIQTHSGTGDNIAGNKFINHK